MAVNHGPQTFLTAAVVFFAHLGSHLQRAGSLGKHQVDASDDVTHLALRVVDDARSVDGIGARSEHAEEVRKPRHGDAKVGICGVAPRLVETESAETAYVDRSELVVDVKTGGP